MSLVGVTLAAGAMPPSTGGLAFAVVHPGVPRMLEGGRTHRVELTLRNEGSEPWDPARGMFVSYHWLDGDRQPVVWDGLRTPLPGIVDPGGDVTLTARLAVPSRRGRFLLQWDLVQEKVCWFSERMDRSPPVFPVLVDPAPVEHALSIVSGGEVPPVMVAGRFRKVLVRVRNDGTLTWEEGEPFNLSSKWFGLGGRQKKEGARAEIPGTVRPGESVEVEAVVRAPVGPGLYRFRWDMVHEGVMWFARQDPTPEPEITVLVLPNPFATPSAPLVVASLLLLVAWRVRRRGVEAHWFLVGLASVADLLWLLVSLTVKQGTVLEAAGRRPEPGSLGIVLSGVAALALVLLFLPRRVRPWIVWLAVAAGSFVILSDVVYARFFDDVISVAVLVAGRQVGQVSDSILSLFARRDLWLAVDLVPGFVLALWCSRIRSRRVLPVRALTAVVLCLLLVPGLRVWWAAAHARRGKFVQTFRNFFLVQEVGVLNFHAVDLWKSFRAEFLRPPLGADGYREVELWFEERRPLRRGTGPWFGTGRGMNLLMIQVESMQGWVPGLRIGGQEVTPNLDSFAKAFVRFERCTDQTSLGRTSDGELTTQVSLLPMEGGVAVFSYAGNSWVGLADVLSGAGYRTLSAVPYDAGFWNRGITHPAFGYAENLFTADFRPGERIGWGLNDRDFLLQMADRLAGLQRPFCAWLITLGLHHPFEGFPDHLKELDVGRWEGTPFGNYIHAMHFFDRAFGEMVAHLGDAGLLENTVIALWGDHDSGLKWSPELAAAIGIPSATSHWTLADRVPFWVHVPGKVGRRMTLAAGQTDVAPTLAAIMGVDPGDLPWLGRNLLGEPGPGPVVRPHGSWLSDRFLYVNRGPELERGECFDARTLGRVPAEACREGNEQATLQVDVARKVLVYDLQERLRRDLAGRSPAGPPPGGPEPEAPTVDSGGPPREREN